MPIPRLHLPELPPPLNPADCPHCYIRRTSHQVSAEYPCGNLPSFSSHPLNLLPAETSYLKDHRSIRLMELLRHHHALHPGRCHSCQTSYRQTQMGNHSRFYHHTTSCTTPLRGCSGMRGHDMNHHDIRCKSYHGMASNMPMPTPSVPPYLSHPGSACSMGYQPSVKLPLNHHPLRSDSQ